MSLILSGTDGLSDVDGSASTPAVRGTDTNTGIFFPAADTIAFAEGGTEIARFDSSGNLGLGKSSPATKLDVTGASNSVQARFGATAGRGLEISVIPFGATVNATTVLNALGAGNGTLTFQTESTERARIDSSGNLLVGVTTAFNSAHTILKSTANIADLQLTVGCSGSVPGVSFHWANNTGTANAANSVMKVGIMSATSRSVSAAGTINASGADYAEYMTKAGDFTVAKGDVVGIKADGKLTNVFADAISFVVKSTDPSYVGGDTWGCGFDNDSEGLEAARQKVDRIAFAGQVPVNVLGAVAGQYIIPVNDNGIIKGEAVSSPTFEQYQIAVGKVIAIEQDGRARIIVKVA